MMDQQQHAKLQARMERIDALPKGIRELIHEHGLTIVQAFLDHKITNPNAIQHLIDRVRNGSIDPGTSEGSKGWVQAGRTMCMVPTEPSPAMIEASMAEVSGGNVVVTKYEKHRLRLRAAIRVGTSRVI